MQRNSVHFYQKQYEEYFRTTVGLDPSSFLTPLVKLLPPGSSLFDVGCGSGRDLLWFAKQGYTPTGFEKSEGLAKLAKRYSNCPVIVGDFYHYDFSVHDFDALLLIAALVHVPKNKFQTVLDEIVKSLRSKGLLLITLKEGRGVSRLEDGRIFTLWKSEELDKIIASLGFEILEVSRRASILRPGEQWLGFLMKKE